MPLGSGHAHLLAPERRQLACACEPCRLLLGGEAGGRWKRVASRVQSLPGFRLSDAAWQSLLVPVEMAFFYRSSATGRLMAAYPSPAGPIESPLSPEAWAGLVQDNPVLATLEEDVEALLVNRVGTHEHYRVSIDRCYTLAGLIRRHWRGFSGGAAVWSEIAGFFAQLRAAAGGTGA